MENGHLFTAAFLLSLVDLSVLGAFLWYQFSTLYFAWHLCPMIVNRVCELIAFLLPGGTLPSLFAVVQVPLSLFSTTVYANRHQRAQSKLLLAVYCTLLVYEFLVAVLMIKMGRYLKCPSRQSRGQRVVSLTSEQAPQPFIALHMFALFAQPMLSGCPFVNNPQPLEGSPVEGFVTVEQPDGKKVMLGKILPPKVVELEKTVVQNCLGDRQDLCAEPSTEAVSRGEYVVAITPNLCELEKGVVQNCLGDRQDLCAEPSTEAVSRGECVVAITPNLCEGV